MFKSLLLCAVLALALNACEKQKQASAEVGAVPKKILDKATTDINNASELAAKQLKDAENMAEPESEAK